MHRPIDPKIDCVFKTLFGSDDRRDLLIHLLNALLAEDLEAPVAEVDILNPYNERETLDDKLTIVDVKARDTARRMFQVEIQLLVFPQYLAPRILYAWADLYSQQLHSGQDYDALRPTYAIWILDQTLFVERPEYAHRYSLRDDQGRRLVDHGAIRLFELSKFQVARVETDAERWLKFLKDGEHLNPEHLPEWMQHPIMRQAMSILSRFSEKERDYHRYQSRQEALRVQRTIQRVLDEARAATEAARANEASRAQPRKPSAKPRKPSAKPRKPHARASRPRSPRSHASRRSWSSKKTAEQQSERRALRPRTGRAGAQAAPPPCRGRDALPPIIPRPVTHPSIAPTTGSATPAAGALGLARLKT
ncbi:Rpn family recombination-promoting nuclease/putative transposase [Thiocapsa sp.]|uniref:Rpn family recombination-promoting nuclease/putative transposase n=1 Tax=Thiocapsa sp. TaxID=2024551 RepID=UPI002616E83D|nr:Rpn family recombination-promoting nuclease/putative transposase [Thiocapsa sp.]